MTFKGWRLDKTDGAFNCALTDLDPLKNVVSATYIVLSGIPLVKDLSGLSNLVEAADLQIGDCGDQNRLPEVPATRAATVWLPTIAAG